MDLCTVEGNREGSEESRTSSGASKCGVRARDVQLTAMLTASDRSFLNLLHSKKIDVPRPYTIFTKKGPISISISILASNFPGICRLLHLGTGKPDGPDPLYFLLNAVIICYKCVKFYCRSP